jgi:predicted MFS family arabinose efflux permease
MGGAIAADDRHGRAPPVVYLAITLYALAFMSQTPTKVYWVKSVTEKDGDAAASYATLQSFFALLQLGGSLVCGALVDRFGGKALLLLSLAASVLHYALTAHASSLLGLLLAAVPTVLQHAVLAGRAYLTGALDHAQHATALGRVSIAYGVGMALGPLIGGSIASAVSLPAAAGFAAALSLATAALVWVALPDLKLAGAAAQAAAEGAKRAPGAAATSYSELLQIPAVQAGLLLKLCFFFSTQLFYSTFGLLAIDHWRMDASEMGVVLSLVGLVSCLAGAAMPLLAGAPPRQVLAASSAGCAAALFALGFAPAGATVYLLIVPQAFLATVFATIQSTQMTTSAPPHLQGSLNAADMALRSLTSIFAPFLAQQLLKSAGSFSGTLVPAALMAGVALLCLVQ